MGDCMRENLRLMALPLETVEPLLLRHKLTSREAFELARWFANSAHDEESFEHMDWILPKFSLAAKYLRACGYQLMEEERTKA